MRKIVFMLVVGMLLVATGVATAEKVTLRWAFYSVNTTFDENVKKVAAAFEKENPDIKVEVEVRPSFWEKLQVEFAAGVAPDVVIMNSDWMPAAVKGGMLEELTPYFKRDKLQEKDYIPLALTDWTFGGKLYAGIMNLAGEMFVYNKRLFQVAGLNYPDLTWDWNIMTKVAKKLTADLNGDGTIDQYGYNASWSVYLTPTSFIRSAGGEILNEARNASRLNEPEALAGVQKIVDMIHKDQSWSPPSRSGMYFSADKIGMGNYGSWDAVAMRDTKPNLEWDFAMPPKGPSKRNLQWGSNGWAITSTTKNKEEAWRLIRYLITQPGQQVFGEHGIPGLLAWAKHPNMLAKWPKQSYATMVEGVIQYGHDYYITEDYVAWKNALAKELTPVWAGTRSPQEGLLKAHEAMNNIFAQRAKLLGG